MIVQHQEEAGDPEEPGDPEPAARVTPVVVPVASQQELGERESLLTQPRVDWEPSPEDVLEELPDPTQAGRVMDERLEQLREDQARRQDQRVVRNFERVVAQAKEYLLKVGLPTKVALSLSECIQRTLEHNYSILFEAHNPAISLTQVVEAEAAFDTEFFLDTGYQSLDQAVASPFAAGQSDIRNVGGGFRKLLPSGMQTSVGLSLMRRKTNLPEDFQTVNPVYDTVFTVNFMQPLLRGFGLDVNRAQINIRKVEYQISYEQFIQQVRDTLLNVERAYWDLVQKRRAAAILAETVAQNFVTKENMRERREHDATEVEIANSESRWQSEYVRFLESVKNVRDAEDVLKNLMNDPQFKLSDMIEIVPTETPIVAPIALDHFAEVRTALDNRTEIRQARQAIEARRIGTNVSKNAILPQLDLNFQYEVEGMGPSAHQSWNNMARVDFTSYTVGVSFAYNFGERAARAAWRRARLQESQAIVTLNQIADRVVEEINTTIRTLMVRYEQIPPQLTAVRAAVRNLRALQARTQRIDPSYLETELSAVQQIGTTRGTLLGVIISYNVALVELEAAKGALLEYNNVVVTDGTDRR